MHGAQLMKIHLSLIVSRKLVLLRLHPADAEGLVTDNESSQDFVSQGVELPTLASLRYSLLNFVRDIRLKLGLSPAR